ncbi:transposase [Streptomyces sp. NPDC127051]|uniref:transposase n=1 Tax=Streptomyces sp. NPDC127051 TaxID=3347119 RepID=UPI00364D160A
MTRPLRRTGSAGFRSEAAFASFAGVSPIPAPSGLTNRHRLNCSGDRQLNRAMHTITLIRMRLDPSTKTYVARKAAGGKTSRDAQRCLKRVVRAVPKSWRGGEGAGHGVVTMSVRAATNRSRLPLWTDDLARHRLVPEPRCAVSLPPCVSSSRHRWLGVRGCHWRSGWSGCRTRAIAGVCVTRSWRCC